MNIKCSKSSLVPRLLHGKTGRVRVRWRSLGTRLLQICMRCHQQCGDHHKVDKTCFHIFQILSTFKTPWLQANRGVSVNLSFLVQCILELQLLKVPSSRSRSGFSLLLLQSYNYTQCYRYIGAVGSHLNYLWTEYGAPTSSSLHNRTGTKTHFKTRCDVDLYVY